MAIRNAMTIDVEDYFHVSAFASSIKRSEWDSYECRIEYNTNRLLDLFASHDVSATFFILGWVAERYPSLVKDIALRGHEVACHGYTHRLVYEQTPAEFLHETKRAKSVLEDLTQKKISGYRAASYSITAQSLWALDILVELGFDYDSSIFPVRHDRYGIPDSRREPHRLRTPAGYSILEFPLSTIEILRFRLPVSGGGYFRLFPYFASRKALKSINHKEGRPFIFYLHPWEIDPDQPSIKAGRFSRFRHYNNLGKCESRLRWLLEDFKFSSAKEVLNNLQMLDYVNTEAST